MLRRVTVHVPGPLVLARPDMPCNEVATVAGVTWLIGSWRTRSSTSRARLVPPSVVDDEVVDEFALMTRPSVPERPITSTLAATSTSTSVKPASDRIHAHGRTYG